MRGIVETGGARAGASAAALSASAPRSPCQRRARTCPSRTRRSSGARMDTAGGDPSASRRCCATARARARRRSSIHESRHRSRGHPRARRSPARRRASSARGATARASTAGTSVLDSSCWERGARRPHGVDVASATSARIPVDGAPAVGSHRRRPRGRLPAREYRKALKDRLSPAVRQGRRHADPPHATSRTPRPTSRKLVCYDCGVACDLDGMKSERLYLPAAHERLDAARVRRRRARAAAAERAGASRARPSRRRRACAQGDGAPLPPALHQARARRLPRPPRSRSATCRACSGAPGSRSSTRSAFTPSPSWRSARRWGSASRRWASCST